MSEGYKKVTRGLETLENVRNDVRESLKKKTQIYFQVDKLGLIFVI